MKVVYKKNFFILIMVYVVIFGCAAGLMTKSDKYTTPEKTWETYREAIFKGDMEAAFDCFADYVKDMARRRYVKIGLEGIREGIRTIKGFQLIESATINNPLLKRPAEYKEYMIATEKGPAKIFIFFVKIAGEWKIEQMPVVMDLESFQP